jgi:hypothetical protein
MNFTFAGRFGRAIVLIVIQTSAWGAPCLSLIALPCVRLTSVLQFPTARASSCCYRALAHVERIAPAVEKFE